MENYLPIIISLIPAVGALMYAWKANKRSRDIEEAHNWMVKDYDETKKKVNYIYKEK